MNKDQIYPSQLSVRKILITAFSTAIFLLLFLVLYKPTFNIEESSLTQWREHESFCIPILSSIVLLVIVGSRFLCRWYLSKNTLTRVGYTIWMAAELFVVGLFSSLFISLYFDRGYFYVMPDVVLYLTLVLIFPFTIITLCINKKESTRTVDDDKKTKEEKQEKNSIVRFADEKGQIRLAIPKEDVYYLEAAGNYITIYYEKNGETERYAIRNTLKGIDSTCNGWLIRCHRSYFLNPSKVKEIRREHDFLSVALVKESLPLIPVSKTYSSEIIRRIEQKYEE